MISEALELYMEGGRVNHSCCMCVVSHGYGGLHGGRNGVIDGMHAGQSQGSWPHARRNRSTSRVRGGTLMTPNHTAIQVRRGNVESSLVRLPGKTLTQDARRRLWFVVHAASCLHSMVLHERLNVCRNLRMSAP